MYHRFGAGDEARNHDLQSFSKQLEIIRRRYRPTRLTDIVERLRAQEPLAARSVAITVDDGYRDFVDLAVPLLERYEVPATVYVVPQFVSQQIWLWFDALHWLIACAPAGRYQIEMREHVEVIALTSPSERHLLWLRLADQGLECDPDQQSLMIRNLETNLGLSLPRCPTDDYASMTWENIRGLDRGLIEVGAHTASHALLSKCTEDRQLAEICKCKSTIEHETGYRVVSFCYPNGQGSDFTAETVDMVRACGFTNAVTAMRGLVGRYSDLFRLNRLPVSSDMRLFSNATSGIWHLRGRLRGLG
jgi:peptidoglycan/xylan/chitin deacetylase (PgdA/CDA1 family)